MHSSGFLAEQMQEESTWSQIQNIQFQIHRPTRLQSITLVPDRNVCNSQSVIYAIMKPHTFQLIQLIQERSCISTVSLRWRQIGATGGENLLLKCYYLLCYTSHQLASCHWDPKILSYMYREDFFLPSLPSFLFWLILIDFELFISKVQLWSQCPYL